MTTRLPTQILTFDKYDKYYHIGNFIEGKPITYLLGTISRDQIIWYKKGQGDLVYDGNSLILFSGNNILYFSGYSYQYNIYTYNIVDNITQLPNYPIMQILEVL